MADYNKMVTDLRRNFRAGKMRSLQSRLNQLNQLLLLLEENEDAITGAAYEDLHKCKVECNMSEILMIKTEIGEVMKMLPKWIAPEKVSTNMLNAVSSPELRKDPLGVVLIIGAWNYPILLTLNPLVGALAGGNCVIIKPSEVSPKTAALLAELVPKYFDQDCVRVVNGSVPETTALLRERFDHIFYTGSPAVGKIVMKAASEHLTPVTLELGGKCPTIVDNTCDFDTVAQRITWAKFANAGQTCLAVDYIICVGDIQTQLTESLKKAITKFYGEDPKVSDSYGRMVNARHFKRVCNLINKDKVVFGGITDEDSLYISPTIMTNVSPDDTVMNEEIFGPLIPMMTVDSVEEAIDFVNDREKPLALYIFSKNSKSVQMVSDLTSSGGFCVNDCIIHVTVPSLPFGGVGNSGMGGYHGKFSFDTFTHKKAYLAKGQGFEYTNSIRYPPYDENWSVYQWSKWFLSPKAKK